MEIPMTGYVVVDSLFIVAPIFGVWSLFCYSTLCVLLDGKEGAGCFTLIVFLIPCG